jgi:hypothetical protein
VLRLALCQPAHQWVLSTAALDASSPSSGDTAPHPCSSIELPWCGEHVGVLGFAEGATSSELLLTGASPLPRTLWPRGPTCRHGLPPLVADWATLWAERSSSASLVGLGACVSFLFYSFQQKCNFVLILVKIISGARKVQMRWFNLHYAL